MSGESLPSGVLKVADLLIEARIEGDSRYTLRTSAVAFAKGAEFALNIARRYLASPPPQATGALGPLTDAQIEPLFYKAKAMEVVGEKDEFFWFGWGVELAERAHGIGAALQVEPEDKHG